MDHLHTLNDLTPKVKSNGRGGIDPNLIFGIDSKLFNDPTDEVHMDGTHNDEVQTMTIWRGPCSQDSHACLECHARPHIHRYETSSPPELTKELVMSSLAAISNEDVWRIKGFVCVSSPPETYIVNWAFGRVELTNVVSNKDEPDVRLTVMGRHGELKRAIRKFAEALGAQIL